MTARLIACALAALLAAPAFAEPPKKAPLLEQLDAEGRDDVASASQFVAGLQLGRRYGSAIVVEDGLLLTTTGVINAQSDKVIAYLPGRVRTLAKVVAIDQKLNMTLLSYSVERAGEVAPVRWADSDKVKTGQLVYSLGNPFGTIIQTQRVSASSGLVSGRYSIGQGDRPYAGELIETTAAINPGSFGGPVVDLRGRVVGMAHRGITYKRWLGTLIPSKVVRGFVARYKAGKTDVQAVTVKPKVETGPPAGFLGIKVVRAAIRMGRRPVAVVRITAVRAGSPADRAQLKSGDILMLVNGKPMRAPAHLDAVLAKAKAGDEVELTLLRRSGRRASRVVVKIVLGSPPM